MTEERFDPTGGIPPQIQIGHTTSSDGSPLTSLTVTTDDGQSVDLLMNGFLTELEIANKLLSRGDDLLVTPPKTWDDKLLHAVVDHIYFLGDALSRTRNN